TSSPLHPPAPPFPPALPVPPVPPLPPPPSPGPVPPWPTVFEQAMAPQDTREITRKRMVRVLMCRAPISSAVPAQSTGFSTERATTCATPRHTRATLAPASARMGANPDLDLCPLHDLVPLA